MTTTPSEIFIKSCKEKNVNKDFISHFSHFSRDPQGLWDSQENPTYMLHLLSYFSGKVGSKSRKAHIKCLIETVKPCMRNIPKGEKRPLRLMAVLEKYCEGTATIAEVEKAKYNYNDVLDYASWAVWSCAGFAIENVYYYASNAVSNAAFYAANSEGGKEDKAQYNKNSCKIIRNHFPKIPGLESVKVQENRSNQVTITSNTQIKINDKVFTLSAEEFQALKKAIKDHD